MQNGIMTALSVNEIITILKKTDVEVWLDGGWAVDALFKKQTREHEDLDVVVNINQIPIIKQSLSSKCFKVTEDELPTRLVMTDTKNRRIDFHTVTFDNEGGGIQKLQDGRTYRYPPHGFIGFGEVGGQKVKCLTAEVQAECHYGYQPDDKDRHDMRILNRYFGIVLKNPYI
ncbi:MAG: hypothetical protein PHQ86_05115 [Dehalococcoidales bacterium]|nr:hypothetical protein [Dehalococcoidales bacterium]